MRHRWVRIVLIVSVAFAVRAPAAAEGLQFAELHDFKLQSGEVIGSCQAGYRTAGELNQNRSNAILFPTWFSGTTQNLIESGWIGPGKLADTSKYFVVAVEALGNGVSCSPSNSREQPGETFPRFTIADMVESQRRLLTEELGIERLHAVVGISMGGMQTFQWIVSHPDWMEKAVSLVGTPRQTPYDVLLWNTELDAIEKTFDAYEDPDQAQRAAMSLVAGIHELAVRTPEAFNADHKLTRLPAVLANKQAALIQRMNALDWASQLRAMIGHDASLLFGGSLNRAAQAVRAELFVIVASEDHMVNPTPALEFARHLEARTMELEGPCGHLAIGCKQEKVTQAVAEFLSR